MIGKGLQILYYTERDFITGFLSSTLIDANPITIIIALAFISKPINNPSLLKKAPFENPFQRKAAAKVIIMKLIQKDIFFKRFNEFLYFQMQNMMINHQMHMAAAGKYLEFNNKRIVIIDKRLIIRKIKSMSGWYSLPTEDSLN